MITNELPDMYLANDSKNKVRSLNLIMLQDIYHSILGVESIY